jgi:hypothetical protein
LRTFVVWHGEDVVVDVNIPPCSQLEPFAPCVFHGTVVEGFERCLFLSTGGGVSIGPLDDYGDELMAGDAVTLSGRWEPVITTFCGHPHGPYFFAVESIGAAPAQLPNTGGSRESLFLSGR